MNSRVVAGLVLVAIGGLLFLGRGWDFSAGHLIGLLWPALFVIPLGVFFHWLYFSMTRRGVGLLIPGGVLLTVGVVCQLAMLTDGWAYLWPGFIFAPAAGLFEFYFFGNRNRYLLIPIAILTTLSLIFFAVFSIGALLSGLFGRSFLPVLILLAGAFILLGRKKSA